MKKSCYNCKNQECAFIGRGPLRCKDWKNPKCKGCSGGEGNFCPDCLSKSSVKAVSTLK